MALIRCRECGKKISEFCGTCPNCGYPIESCTPNKEENDTVKGCSNENNISGNEFSNEESNKTAGMPNEEYSYDLKQPKQMELSYSQKKNQLIVRSVFIAILVLAGLALVAFPFAYKDDVYSAARWDWYEETVKNGTYEATIDEWYNEYLDTDEGSELADEYEEAVSSSSRFLDPNVAFDNVQNNYSKMMAGFDRYVSSQLSGKIFMKQLPYFIGGIVCFVIAGYLVTTLKRYALVKKND